MKHFAEALKDSNEYIILYPSDPLGYIKLAITYREQGEFGKAKAIDQLNTARKYAANDPVQLANIERLMRETRVFLAGDDRTAKDRIKESRQEVSSKVRSTKRSPWQTSLTRKNRMKRRS